MLLKLVVQGSPFSAQSSSCQYPMINYLIADIKNGISELDRVKIRKGWVKRLQVRNDLLSVTINMTSAIVMIVALMIFCTAIIQKIALMNLFKVSFSVMYSMHKNDAITFVEVITIRKYFPLVGYETKSVPFEELLF